MQLALSNDPADGRTLQERVYRELRAMIDDGRLRPGVRLPSTRTLAAELGLSRTTVVLAFERLAAEGYIETRGKRGTFVCAVPPERGLRAAPAGTVPTRSAASPPATVPAPAMLAVVRPDRPRPELDLWVGRPDPALFPLRAWREAVEARLARAGPGLTDYRDPAGDPELRAALAARVGPARGIAATSEDVVVVQGSQDGLNLVARMLGDRGRILVHEDPCYRGALDVLRPACGRRVAVPVDRQGIRVDRLPTCRGGLLYLTRSHHYPLGVTLAAERRTAVLEWADRTGSWVIEDDYDGDFRYEEAPLPALKAQDGAGRVIYLATFSKSLGPGLRLGYLLVPSGLREAAAAWKALMSIASPWLEQVAMAELLASGAFDRHLRRIRHVYRARRDALVAALEERFGPVELSGRRGGMHLAWRLPETLPRAEEVERRALEVGVGVYGLRSAGAWASPGNPRLDDTLLLGYAALAEPQIRCAIDRLAGALPVGSAPRRTVALAAPTGCAPAGSAVRPPAPARP